MSAGPKYPGLQTQPAQYENDGVGLQAIRRFLRAQFGRPTGFWGSVAGRIMTHSASNRNRIDWTLSLLDVQPQDRILEIGFGPGFAIERVGRMATKGFIAGVDHSDVMVRQATKRNAKAIRDGKVVLRLGSAADVPKFDEPFDKIFTINSIHFWHEPIECLRKLRKLLKFGGRIAVTLQPRSRGATDSATREIGGEIARNLGDAGFSQVRLEMKESKPVPIVCALGIRDQE